MAKLTEGQVSFLREPNFGVVADLREDGSPHQTVVWVDSDGEHVLLNLTTTRAKTEHMKRDPRVSVVVVDRENWWRWLGIEGKVVDITPEGAYEHIVKQAGVYLGKEEYPLREGEQRLLVKIAPERIEPYNVE